MRQLHKPTNKTSRTTDQWPIILRDLDDNMHLVIYLSKLAKMVGGDTQSMS